MSWYNWCYLERHQEIYHFVIGMIAFGGAHPVLSKEQFYTDVEIHWFGPQGGLPNWADSRRKALACMIHEKRGCVVGALLSCGDRPAPCGDSSQLSRWFSGERARGRRTGFARTHCPADLERSGSGAAAGPRWHCGHARAVQGDPAHEIVNVAGDRNVDLIMNSPHGYGAL